MRLPVHRRSPRPLIFGAGQGDTHRRGPRGVELLTERAVRGRRGELALGGGSQSEDCHEPRTTLRGALAVRPQIPNHRNTCFAGLLVGPPGFEPGSDGL